MRDKSIGLLGHTGTGKSTVATYLQNKHAYTIINTGRICRNIAQIVFGNEDKSNLMALTDALQSIDKSIFLKSALRQNEDAPLKIIDAIRYEHDFSYAKENGFILIRLVAPKEMRRTWLESRGQNYDFEIDELHSSEQELARANVDITISNNGSLEELYEKINYSIINISATIKP